MSPREHSSLLNVILYVLIEKVKIVSIFMHKHSRPVIILKYSN